MVKPRDIKLYEKAKKTVYKREPKHSAYRSIRISKEYKKLYDKKYSDKKYYIGDKSKSKLQKWIKEKWVNEKGKTGYNNGSLYRPSVRVDKTTPKTWNELKLSKKELNKLKNIKKKKGRVFFNKK